MKEKKPGLLFPEIDNAEKKQKTKKNKETSLFHDTLNKIQTEKDKKLRSKLIQETAKSRMPWVVEILIHCLDDPSEEIRDLIIKELAKRDNIDLNLLYRRLLRPPWYAKTGCLKILGQRKEASSVEHIRTLMNDSNIEVRRTVACVFGEIGTDNALALLAKLTKDSSSFVRTSARRALQKASQLKFS
jgi:HEAT repeat protein